VHRTTNLGLYEKNFLFSSGSLSTGFPVAIFAGLLRGQMLYFLLQNPLNFLVPLCFGSSSSSSSFRAPCRCSLRPSLVLRAYYVSIQFQRISFHSFQNCLFYFHFSLNTSFLTLMTRKFFQLFSWIAFLYLTVFLTFNPLFKFPNRNLKYFQSLFKIFVSLYLIIHICSKEAI